MQTRVKHDAHPIISGVVGLGGESAIAAIGVLVPCDLRLLSSRRQKEEILVPKLAEAAGRPNCQR
jgi:hypothetical protein